MAQGMRLSRARDAANETHGDWRAHARRPLRRSGGARAHRQPGAGGAARWSTGSSTACTGRRTSARRWTSPSTAATSPGDDIRRVDWRLYARTDRFYIKEYEADTNANFSVLLDVSKSMGFGSRGITKLEYAQDARRLPDLSRAPAARPRRARRVRRRHRRARAAVGEAHGRRRCTRSTG